jgi:hypothetical protein
MLIIDQEMCIHYSKNQTTKSFGYLIVTGENLGSLKRNEQLFYNA